MAQRKSPPPAAKRPAQKSTARTPGTTKRKGKSIVNQKQTPWGMIIAAVCVVAFAGAIVGVVLATSGGSDSDAAAKPSTVSTGGQQVDKNDPYRHPAYPAAMAIKGVTYRVEGSHNHVTGTVGYDASPPVGGDHSQIWADCTGKVYDHQLANENAVHMLEHGAVWITYNPDDLSKAQIATLAKNVSGVDRTAMTPYAGLKTPVSLQAWGYQLFVNSVTDPRIAQFVKTLAGNQATWPEQGASCSDPYFKADDSRPGHPQENA